MLKKFILWILRCVSILAGLAGILMIIGGATGFSDTLIAGIIVLIIALGVNSSLLKKSDKAHTEHRQKCKKCGESLVGAGYKYRLGKMYKEGVSGVNYILPTVTVTCPHCGKNSIISEKVYVNGNSSVEEMEREVENQLNGYYR